MAISPHQAGRTDDRREKGHRRFARGSVFEGISVQTDFPRSLGDSASDVTQVTIYAFSEILLPYDKGLSADGMQLGLDSFPVASVSHEKSGDSLEVIE